MDRSGRRFEAGVHVGAGKVGTQHDHAMTARVGDKGGRGVEAHRLRAQEAGEEGSRVVQLHPG
jgi:hypothetical protein